MFYKFLVVLFTHFVGVRVADIKAPTNIIENPHETKTAANKFVGVPVQINSTWRPGYNRIIRFHCEEVRDIVDMHNKVRLLASRGEIEGQPGYSKGLPLLVWDYELQQKATFWAQKIFIAQKQNRPILLDIIRNVPSNRWITGENNFFISTTGKLTKRFDPRIAIYSWYMGHQFYSKFEKLTIKMLRKPDRPVMGYYTQMVWADTTHLGCAMSQQPLEYGFGWNEFFFVCHYGTAGNVIGERPYLPTKEGQKNYQGHNLTCDNTIPECCCPYGYKYVFNSTKDC